MISLLYLVPLALLLGAAALGTFFWSLRSGQYEDLDGAGERIFIDETGDRAGARCDPPAAMVGASAKVPENGEAWTDRALPGFRSSQGSEAEEIQQRDLAERRDDALGQEPGDGGRGVTRHQQADRSPDRQPDGPEHPPALRPVGAERRIGS
jgi:cbb3-type cytochrome oxidase maturation protein